MRAFALSYILFCCCLLEVCSFLKGNRGVVDPEEGKGGRQLGGGEEGGPAVGMYYMREESVFNNKKLQPTKTNIESLCSTLILKIDLNLNLD